MKFVLSLILIFFSINLYSNEKLGAQEIINKLDESIQIKDGITYAILKIKKNNYDRKIWNLKFFKKDKNLIIHFIEPNRLLNSKLFSIQSGEKIIYYKTLSGKFYQIEEKEKLDSILFTSFSFIDFAFKPYENNFIAKEFSKPDSHEDEDIMLDLKPISIPNYSLLKLKCNKEYIPKKIDFFNDSNLLIKIAKFKFGKIKHRNGNFSEEVFGLKKIEMVNIDSNETSILEITEYDKSILPDTIFFEWKSMYEK